MNDAAQPFLYWYSVSYAVQENVMIVQGSSPFDEPEFARSVVGSAYVCLDNLVYYDKGAPRPWHHFSLVEHARIYINPGHIISFTPLRGNPQDILRADSPAQRTVIHRHRVN